MHVVIGSDHAGFHLRQRLTSWLVEHGHSVENIGPTTPEEVDYPLVAEEVGQRMKADRHARGILICGSGVGMSIAANKVQGLRAALAHDVYSAHQCVEHDNANVLCLGGQVIGPWLAEDLVASFLSAKLEHRDDFLRRVKQIDELEKAWSADPR